MKNDVLFEIGVEELPASEMDRIKEQLLENAKNFLKESKIDCGKIECHVTNRRICLLIEDLSEKQQDTSTLKKGPSEKVAFLDGKPTKALMGFLVSNQASENDILLQDGYVFINKKIEGKNTDQVLPELFKQLIESLKFTKPMRWGDGQYEFVRPIKWILCLYQNRVLPVEVFGLRSSNQTQGHPYLGKTIVIDRPSEYVEVLRKSFVLVNETERIERIKRELKEIEEKYGLVCEKDEEMIKKVAKITEWPLAIVGRFRDEYLRLPAELINVTIRHHLSAFTTNRNGKITSHFVAFLDRPDGDLSKVIEGYQNVVNARLEDARYYLEMDEKYNLEQFNEKLKEMVFQKELGTLYDKVNRIEQISLYMVDRVGLQAFSEKVQRAARLSKADIATHVVYEFPELQGVMGRIYALLSGEDPEVAHAIEEQYSDNLQTKIGAVIGIADRIDTIMGNLAIGNIPSGSKDPFGLRSKMETIYKTIVHHRWDIDIPELLDFVLSLLKIQCDRNIVDDFMSSRYYAFLSNLGFSYDVSRAVNHLWTKPLRGFLSAKALSEMASTEDFNKLCVGFERVHNITKNHNDMHFDGALFEKQAETDLLNQFVHVKSIVLESLKELNYEKGLRALITLKPYIDEYFNEVFVMSDREDIRKNRLGFLKNIDSLFMLIGDLTQLVKRE
ncbi:MAG: glycine--tRNA ligase subunit beta [Pseudothermotoga sp.]